MSVVYVPVHKVHNLAMNTRVGNRPDDRPNWKRGRARYTWIRQLQVDERRNADTHFKTKSQKRYLKTEVKKHIVRIKKYNSYFMNISDKEGQKATRPL